MELSSDLGFIKLKNPLIVASGTFGYGVEFAPFFDLNLCGAIILKGIYRNERAGNPPPRIWETYGGVLNSVGLAGVGMAELEKIIEKLAAITAAPIVVNVCGQDDQEYLDVAEFFSKSDKVAFLQINISCPNVKAGGRCPAQDADHTFRLVREIKQQVRKKIMVKLTPNTDQIEEVAFAAQEAGADALSLVNTFLATAVNLEKRSFVFKKIFAGYSGPAIKPLAQRIIWQVIRKVSLPVVASGGIFSGRDVLEYILLGASAVQLGTVNLTEPAAVVRILKEIEALMIELKINSLDEIRGQIKC